jgi:AraC-like DNA-binding protein
MMKNIIAAHGAASLIQLLQMLELMAQTKEYRLLHNADYAYNLKESETRRINLVINYAARHFQKRIALDAAAALLNMTPTSFSRYFRMKTSKSFSEFITELRIRHACKLLSEDDDRTISQVSYECGFNTLSNFNRQFKRYMKMTPKTYREQFSTL